MPSICKSTLLRGTCQGHLGKFDSCRDEALYDITLDQGDGCGDSDWHGHCTLVVIEDETEWTLDCGPTVEVPAGFFIVHVASSGAVCVYEFSTEAAAQMMMKVWTEAYNAWDASS